MDTRPRRARQLPTVIGATLVAALGSVVLLGAVSAASPVTRGSAATQFYVSVKGSASAPCSKSRPCNTVDRAVALANRVAFTDTPVVINVGKGSFVTHLNFPDQSYPEPMLTILGSSAPATILTPNGSKPELTAFADAPQITIEHLTISGGRSGESAAAVHDGGNFMSFSDVTFSHNKTVVTQSLGGAVDDDGGDMTITGSRFVDNSIAATTLGGGAVSEQGGTLTIIGSLFTGNSVENGGSGGAVYVNDGHLSIVGSTFTGNSATGAATGGAIGLDESARTTVTGSTINGNSAGGAGGLVAGAGTPASSIQFGGDVLLGNLGAGGSVCSGARVDDLGYNVIDETACSFGAKSKVASASAIGVKPLAGNGGLTKTERIEKASAAHDVVPLTAKMAGKVFCAGEDQRGVPRRQGPASKCDAGAYQFAPPVITGISPGKGAPGTDVTIRGYGFVFLTLRFGGAAPRYSVSGDVKVTTIVPSLGAGAVTVRLSNPDGKVSVAFKVLAKPNATG
jgi:hypothetical protein